MSFFRHTISAHSFSGPLSFIDFGRGQLDVVIVEDGNEKEMAAVSEVLVEGAKRS